MSTSSPEPLLAAVGVTEDDLAATPQDPGYHSEGDVWTHTQMAVEALVTGPRYAALDDVGKRIVRAAVLLHDVGKPTTTRRDGDRWTSRGHSARGDHLVRVGLWRAGFSFAEREHVCALVRNHQVPMFGITRPDLDRLAIKLSLVTRHDWLVAVADADARGRRTADPKDQATIVEHCALWEEHARELGILDRPRAFASDHTRRVYFEADDRHPDTAAFDDTTCEATLLSGLPASGKNTWLARQGLPVISLDDLRAEADVDPDETGKIIQTARERAREYLRAGTSFAWNATNLTAQLRGQLLQLFRDYRARTRIVYVEAPERELRSRNRARGATAVPDGVIDRMLEKWSIPEPHEAHSVIFEGNSSESRDLTWPPGT